MNKLKLSNLITKFHDLKVRLNWTLITLKVDNCVIKNLNLKNEDLK